MIRFTPGEIQMKRWISVVALSLFAALAAQAHTQLSTSRPADGAVLDAAPQQLMLHFSEPVRMTAWTMQGPADQRQDLPPLPKEASADFSASLPSLPAGEYVVSWRALSADTHVLNGVISFTVRAAAGHGEHSGH
jgi:methionine-rich copper-binding protein CopC